MNIEQAMVEAMTNEECYQKPKQEQKKPNTVSEGVSAIIEALRKSNGSSKEKNHSKENHDH